MPDEHVDCPESAKAAWHSFEPECDDDGSRFQPGARVVHEAYGAGEVVRVSGQGFSARAFVRFDDGEERQLILEYADLQVVSEGSEW